MYAPIEGTFVIGLGYKARQGKDLAASIIARKVGCDVHRFAFSDAISSYARVMTGMRTRDPKLLQTLGYVCRQGRPGVWLDALYGAIADRRPRLAIVTGVRFADEAQLVSDMGGVNIEIRRWNPDGSRYVADDRPADDPTEHGLDGFRFDYVLDNRGTLADFEDAVMQTYTIIAEIDDGAALERAASI